MGLSAATGPFAKVGCSWTRKVNLCCCCVLLSQYFAHALSVPVPFPSLLVDTAVAGDVGCWFAGRDNSVATRGNFGLIRLCCLSNHAHTLPVLALSHAYAGAVKDVIWWLAAAARTRYENRSILRSVAIWLWR